MTQPVPVTRLQFNGTDPLSPSLRRLVQDLATCENAVNALISDAASAVGPDGAVAKHVLADAAGLGADHTTSGLTVGQVLRAISATNAAFAKLSFKDLAQTDITAPQNDQVLQFINGYWTNVDFAVVVDPTKGANLGTGVGVYANKLGLVLQFKSIVQGIGIKVSSDGETITLSLGDAATVTALLDAFTTTLQGMVPAPGSVNGYFLSDSGAWLPIPSPLTTKGDLYGFDTAIDRVPVGADGHALIADSTQALGLKWAPIVATTYIFTQASALGVWAIGHGLGAFPSVTVVDSSEREVDGDVAYVDANNLTVSFSAPFSGVAYLN